jgi:hypothetical protein
MQMRGLVRRVGLLVLLIVVGAGGLTLVGNMTPAVAQADEVQITPLDSIELPSYSPDIVVAGGYAYIPYRQRDDSPSRNGFLIYDVRDPTMPTLISDYPLDTRIQKISVVGEYLYAASDDGLLIFAVADPRNPAWVGTYQAARDSSSSMPLDHVTVIGTTAYVTTSFFAWLDIVDVGDPTQPTLIGRYIDEQEAAFVSVALQNNLLYATGNGFQIIDVSTPSAPTLLGSYGGRDGVDLAVQGDIVYLGSVTRTPIGVEGAVSLVDVQDSTQPTFLSNANVIAARIKVQNGFAYVAPGQVGQGRSGMTIVNVQDPTNPTPIISYEQDVLAIFPVNDLVYFTSGTPLSGYTLHVVRVQGLPDPPADPPSPTARCFDETRYCIDGRIRDYWEQNGGLPVFGFPISSQRTFTIEGQPIEAQWFERNRLELHPENEPPYDVLLGRLGVDVLAQQGRDWQAFPTADAPQPGCRYFAETQQNVCGDILSAWRANGLELGDPGISERESLALFGLPISPLQEEDIEGQTYQVQWFERARFELHPENEPPFNVLLGLLGAEAIP